MLNGQDTTHMNDDQLADCVRICKRRTQRLALAGGVAIYNQYFLQVAIMQFS